ncbi:hypothetical protein GT04_004362 [Salmonella enterica subsp. enterica]|nr:hypothetical protein [Salmonella enterica subsp. enterica serovar Bareilly]ECH8535531.1 hypothetical protein [Salmonella enterica subsp. enterica serovar Lexington]EDV9690047.1 hypothetical protein [Salmonella enterica subsp. enterica serovar Lexington]
MSGKPIREKIYVTYSVYRAVFFSLVTAPAIALFVGFILLSFNNSIAGSFLGEARSYVADTPVDKVRVCLFRKKVEQVQVMESSELPPPLVYKEKCMTTLIDADDWQQSVDSTIRQLYWKVAFLGLVLWCFQNMNFSVVIEKCKAIKNRRGL